MYYKKQCYKKITDPSYTGTSTNQSKGILVDTVRCALDAAADHPPHPSYTHTHPQTVLWSVEPFYFDPALAPVSKDAGSGSCSVVYGTVPHNFLL